jgi:hypothetical protein
LGNCKNQATIENFDQKGKSIKNKLERTLSGENNDLIFYQNEKSKEIGSEDSQFLEKSRQIMENKKHIRLAAYFGQNLRRLCLLEVGLIIIVVVQFLLVAIFGLFTFPTTKEFFGFLKGDFLYKDYLGLVTANCFVLGLLTFGMSYFLNRREFFNQKVLYREVLKNELRSDKELVQKKFLSPHVVYFSGLNQQIKKSDFEEELQEFIDYGRENDSLSSENGSLILDEERSKDEKYGNFTKGFKKGKDLTGRLNNDHDESIDRMFINIRTDNQKSVRTGHHLDGNY